MRGFTAIELLVALGIVAVLIGILVPVLGGVRREAWRTQCLANLRSLGFALEAYRKDYKVWPDSPEYPDVSAGTISLARALTQTGAIAAPMPVKGETPRAPWRCPGDGGFSVRVGMSYEYLVGSYAQLLRFQQANNPQWRTVPVWERVAWYVEQNPDLPLMTDAHPAKVKSVMGREIWREPWHGFGPERQFTQAVFIDGSAGWDRRAMGE